MLAFPLTLVPAGRLLPFVAVAAVLVITPGPDFAMTTRNVLRSGRRAGIFTALGVATGTAIWTTASVLGLVTILRVSSTAFTAVKLAGAIYLIYLGLRSLISAVSNRGSHLPDTLAHPRDRITFEQRGLLRRLARRQGNAQQAGGMEQPVAGVSGSSEARPSPGIAAYRQGLLCNVLNPKAAAIFTGVIPQFVVAGRAPEMQLVEFGLVFVVLVGLWLSFYSTVAAGLGSVLGSRFRRAVDGITGCVLVGLGVRLATE